jgi:hypothetical protein
VLKEENPASVSERKQMETIKVDDRLHGNCLTAILLAVFVLMLLRDEDEPLIYRVVMSKMTHAAAEKLASTRTAEPGY